MTWSKQALDQFAAWGGLTPEQASDAGLFEVDSAREIYRDFDPAPAIIIPYYSADGALTTFLRDGEELPFCRLRYIGAVAQQAGFFKEKPKRYAQPGNSGTRVYFPKSLDWPRIVNDIQEPIVITEGEAKALVAAQHGVTCLALGGVWNYAAKGQEDLLPELAAIKNRGRKIYIIFDSDAATNPQVVAAEARLVDELQRKMGAQCTIVRLPPNGDEKEALDTFLEKFGVDGLLALADKASPCGALDTKVIAFNKSCAWIERDGMIYDMDEKLFIPKDDFVKGSRWSHHKHITVGSKKRGEPKIVSVADTWLTHPHAQRFGDILFRPGSDRVVMSDNGKQALNIWTGWPETQRNDAMVAPFLELTDHVFSKLPPEHQELPLRLIAYKLQNPEKKIPLALVMLGPQGSGKTLWTECVAEIFKPYGAAIPASQFGNQFQGFMERNLLCVVNEAESNYVKQHGERLKSLISDVDQYMDEKFRTARSIKSYTMYMLSANDPAVGSFAQDDRRMVVVGVPKPRDAGNWPVYRELGQDGPWRGGGGPGAVRYWLLNLDLEGWRPPARAPMTPEKYLSFREGLTIVQDLAEQMKTADEHAVKRWMDGAMAWADTAITSNNPGQVAYARAISENIKHAQIRPWYEARELALMFPSLTESLTGAKYDRTTPPGKISRELREAGVPYLVNKDDPRGFKWQGAIRQYLVVYDFEEWESPLTQVEFERHMNNLPTYSQMKARR